MIYYNAYVVIAAVYQDWNRWGYGMGLNCG